MASGGLNDAVKHIAQAVENLRDQTNQRRMLKAAVDLQQLTASTPVIRMLVAEAGGVQVLANVLLNDQHSHELQQAAAKALDDRAQEPSLQQQLGQCALPSLLSVLQRHGKPLPLLLQATQALRATMHSNRKNTLLFVQTGGVQIAAQLLADNSGPMSDGRVVVDLLSLFECLVDPSMGFCDIQAVTVRSISSTLVLLLKHHVPNVWQAALQIIYSCAAFGVLPSKTDALGSLVAAGAIPALLKVASSSNTVGNHLPSFLVVGILTAMVGHHPHQTLSVLLGPDCVTCITRLLSLVTAGTGTSPYPTLIHLLQFISSILFHDDDSRLEQVATDMIAAGALPVLVSAQLQAEKVLLPPIAFDIISRIAALSEAAAVAALAPMLLVENKQEQGIVLEILAHISKCSSTFFKEAVSTSWIADLLTAMHRPDNDGRHLKMAVDILKRAAAASPYIRHAIRKAGAQEVLQKLVADNASTSCNSLPATSTSGPSVPASELEGDVMQLLQLLQGYRELYVDTGEVAGSLPATQACQEVGVPFASQIQAPARPGMAPATAVAAAGLDYQAAVRCTPTSSHQLANRQEDPANRIGDATQSFSNPLLWNQLPGLPFGWHTTNRDPKASGPHDGAACSAGMHSAPTTAHGVMAGLTASRLGPNVLAGPTALSMAAIATVTTSAAGTPACTDRLTKQHFMPQSACTEASSSIRSLNETDQMLDSLLISSACGPADEEDAASRPARDIMQTDDSHFCLGELASLASSAKLAACKGLQTNPGTMGSTRLAGQNHATVNRWIETAQAAATAACKNLPVRPKPKQHDKMKPSTGALPMESYSSSAGSCANRGAFDRMLKGSAAGTRSTALQSTKSALPHVSNTKSLTYLQLQCGSNQPTQPGFLPRVSSNSSAAAAHRPDQPAHAGHLHGSQGNAQEGSVNSSALRDIEDHPGYIHPTFPAGSDMKITNQELQGTQEAQAAATAETTASDMDVNADEGWQMGKVGRKQRRRAQLRNVQYASSISQTSSLPPPALPKGVVQASGPTGRPAMSSAGNRVLQTTLVDTITAAVPAGTVRNQLLVDLDTSVTCRDSLLRLQGRLELVLGQVLDGALPQDEAMVAALMNLQEHVQQRL